jgi:hypothetical protein
MRLYAETGTDAATLAAGDPAVAAPYLLDEPGDGLAEAAEAGALWSTSTGGDGAFGVLVLVDEPPPPELAPHLRDARRGRLELPSGVLRVAGAECFLPEATAAARARLGEDLTVPPGAYGLEAFRVEAPAGARAARVAARTSHGERAAWRAGRVLPWAVILLVLAALAATGACAVRVAAGLGGIANAALALWAAAGAAIGAASMVRRTSAHRAAARAWREAGRDVPSFVLALRREGDARATPAAAPPRTARS